MDHGDSQPHVAICPSSGMGHLMPFLRLASMVASCDYKVTFIAMRPTVSAAESNQISGFFSTHPHIDSLDFHVLPSDTSTATTDDPFYLHFQAISRSAHLLGHQLTTLSPPLSAVFSDLLVANGIGKILSDLWIPNYIVITTSARFYSLMAYLPHLITSETITNFSSDDDGEVEIPGIAPVPRHCIPPPFFNPNHLFTQVVASNCRSLPEAKGIILNTFDFFEPEAIGAHQNGLVLSDLPPVFPIGPLRPFELNKVQHLPWLDDQPAQSVVYVCFGSRTAMTRDQIKELGHGLESSGYRFLWVIKTSKVDREDNEELRGLLGDGFFERTCNVGVVVKEWVNQEEILAHPATGGFINHCGWNSVMEAARHGMPVLAWPQHGDQKVNALVVEKAGLGLLESQWGWAGERLVKGQEIAEKIKELMTNNELKNSARKIKEEARKAWEKDGSSTRTLMRITDMIKKK
ncbi:hypothetical protein Nepgr_006940 [Nepenthes gracilis]|uniref:Glycosyltransferase n=1 Tax=Nepenthes gracilis TaxID=150966 RepID=A0AAD3XHW9_NEPGR|nr:hypothetical protein Nepgr_006940 [Nepenthes gracilis]